MPLSRLPVRALTLTKRKGKRRTIYLRPNLLRKQCTATRRNNFLCIHHPQCSPCISNGFRLSVEYICQAELECVYFFSMSYEIWFHNVSTFFFQQCGTSLRKINKHVEFPLLLDMAPFCSSSCQAIQPGQEKVLYSLYGVVEHSGRMSGGHYVAFVKVGLVVTDVHVVEWYPNSVIVRDKISIVRGAEDLPERLQFLSRTELNNSVEDYNSSRVGGRLSVSNFKHQIISKRFG